MYAIPMIVPDSRSVGGERRMSHVIDGRRYENGDGGKAA
jgi:hypothetical protein